MNVKHCSNGNFLPRNREGFCCNLEERRRTVIEERNLCQARTHQSLGYKTPEKIDREELDLKEEVH